MSELPREGPDGRLGADGDPTVGRRPNPLLSGSRESRLLLAAAVAAAATLIQLGWQTDQLVSALDGVTADIRIAVVSNYIAVLWIDGIVVAAAVATVGLRRSTRWSASAWGALLVLALIRVVTAIPELTARLAMSVPLEPPLWLNTILLLAGLTTGGLLLIARPHPKAPH